MGRKRKKNKSQSQTAKAGGTFPSTQKTVDPSASGGMAYAVFVLVIAVAVAGFGMVYDSRDGATHAETSHEEPRTKPPKTGQPVYTSSCSEDLLRDWLNDPATGEIPGYHVLCVTENKKTKEGRSLTFTAHTNGLWEGSENDPPGEHKVSGAPKELREQLERVLGVVKTDADRAREKIPRNRRLRWEFFDMYGNGLNFKEGSWPVVGMVLLFEGGQFIFPPVRMGFERVVPVMDTAYTISTSSLSPLVFSVKNFLQKEECAGIIKSAKPLMAQSGVSHMKNTKGDPRQWRTSTTTFLSTKQYARLLVINDRVANLTRTPLGHQESVQVLNYKKDQKYDSHWDYFDPPLYEGTPTAAKIAGGRNRMITVFWYMSTVSYGGETVFPAANDAPWPSSYKLVKPEDCDKGGVKVKAEEGKVIIFYSMKPNGDLDKKSLHGACPVGKNGEEKWAGNKWIWNVPAGYSL